MSDDGTRFEDVNRGELRRKLWEWVSGETGPGELVDYAEERLPESSVGRSDARRPEYVVLDALSTIFDQPLQREDGLVLLRYLDLWELEPEEADRALDRYWQSIDWNERLQNETKDTETPFPNLEAFTVRESSTDASGVSE